MNPSHHLGGRPTHATTSFAPTEKRFIIYGGVGRGLSGVHTRLSARGARRLHVQQLYVWGGKGRRVERARPGPNARKGSLARLSPRLDWDSGSPSGHGGIGVMCSS